jgi:hypothetical protein
MNPSPKEVKNLARLSWIFIALGLLEIFVFIVLFGHILLIIPGLITMGTAYFIQPLPKNKWGIYCGAWALVKYNPISLSMLFFITIDIFHLKNPTNLAVIALFCFFAIAVISAVFGVITIIQTVKMNRKFSLQNQ